MKLIRVFYKATEYDIDCLVLIDITLMIKMYEGVHVRYFDCLYCMHNARRIYVIK